MKTIWRYTTVGLLLVLLTAQTHAQGWCQDRTGIYSGGIGGTAVIALGNGFVGETGGGLSVNISGEYKVQRFIGVGFETGMDVFFSNYYGYYNELTPHPYAAIGIPLGIKANVHILEAANLPIASVLDVYAGLNVGGGPAIYTGPGSGAFGFIQAGPQIGIRYWINHNVGVFGEFGWGATFANVGFSF